MFKKLFPKILFALMLLTCGVLWIVGEVSPSFNYDFFAFWPSIFIVAGITFLVGSICYNSPGYLYFFGLLTSFGALFLIDFYGVEQLKIVNTWPFLFSVPGVASLIMFFVRKFNVTHLKIALVSISLAVLLYLSVVVNLLPTGIMIAVIVIVVALIILASVIFRRGKSWDAADNENSNYKSYAERKEDETNQDK